MNGRSLILILIAMTCGLGAMYGSRKLLSRGGAAGKTVEVLVAAHDLKTEEVLKPEMVKVVKMPEGIVPPGSFSSYKDLSERWVSVPMLAGDPILEAKLAPKGAPLGLLPRIPKGMRAFSIEVNEQTGIAGFVFPDHRVDVVLARSNQHTRSGKTESETILQDVLVLAAGQVTTRPEDKSVQVRTVTLALTPDQIDTLVAARTEGTLSLSLRGLDDHEQLQPPAKKAEANLETVLVAATDLKPGDEMIPERVKEAQLPRAYLPSDHIRPGVVLAGRKVRHPIPAGEMILESKLTSRDAPLAAEAERPRQPKLRVPPGLRAVPLRGGDSLTMPEDLRAGDRVDIVYVPSRDHATAGAPHATVGLASSLPAMSSASELLLQNILVLSAPADAAPSPGNAPSSGAPRTQGVVLAVPVAQVASVLQAQSAGQLTLALRDPEDHQTQVVRRAMHRYGWVYNGPNRRERFMAGGESVAIRTDPPEATSALPLARRPGAGF